MRWLCFLVLLLSCASAWAQGGVLQTRMETDSGVKWVDQDQGQSGICPDILNALAKRLGDTRILWSDIQHTLPQQRLLAEVQAGRLDLACAFGTNPARAKAFAIPETVIYINRLVAAVRHDDVLELHTLEDLRALPASDTVLVNWGARLVERLHQLGVPQVDQGGERPEDNLRKLAAGRGRVYLYHEPGMSWEIARNGMENKLKILPAALSKDEHYLLVSRSVDPAMLARLRQALLHMQKDGTLAAITAKWSTFRIAGNE